MRTPSLLTIYADRTVPRVARALDVLQRRRVPVELRPPSALPLPTRCLTCKGRHRVVHPFWIAYYQTYPTPHVEPQDPVTWFRRSGLIGEGEELPAKQVSCPDCDGPALRPRRAAHG